MRAVPEKHRGLALALVVLAVAGLSACGVSSAGRTGTYRGHGVSFDYPAGWQEQRVPPSSQQDGKPLWSVLFASEDPSDVIDVDAYRLDFSVGAADLVSITAPLEQEVRHLFGAGAIRGIPRETTVGKLPGLMFQVAGTAGKDHFDSTVIFAFYGTTEYYLYCQYTLGTAVDIAAACRQMARTFKLSKTA